MKMSKQAEKIWRHVMAGRIPSRVLNVLMWTCLIGTKIVVLRQLSSGEFPWIQKVARHDSREGNS